MQTPETTETDEGKALRGINAELDEYLESKTRQYGNEFDASDLAPQFAPYYHSRYNRVKVQFSYGEIRTGWIGATTGWKPAFLLMAQSRSIGSSDLLGQNDRIIAVKTGGKYRSTKG